MIALSLIRNLLSIFVGTDVNKQILNVKQDNLVQEQSVSHTGLDNLVQEQSVSHTGLHKESGSRRKEAVTAIIEAPVIKGTKHGQIAAEQKTSRGESSHPSSTPIRQFIQSPPAAYHPDSKLGIYDYINSDRTTKANIFSITNF